MKTALVIIVIALITGTASAGEWRELGSIEEAHAALRKFLPSTVHRPSPYSADLSYGARGRLEGGGSCDLEVSEGPISFRAALGVIQAGVGPVGASYGISISNPDWQTLERGWVSDAEIRVSQTYHGGVDLTGKDVTETQEISVRLSRNSEGRTVRTVSISNRRGWFGWDEFSVQDCVLEYEYQDVSKLPPVLPHPPAPSTLPEKMSCIDREKPFTYEVRRELTPSSAEWYKIVRSDGVEYDVSRDYFGPNNLYMNTSKSMVKDFCGVQTPAADKIEILLWGGYSGKNACISCEAIDE